MQKRHELYRGPTWSSSPSSGHKIKTCFSILNFLQILFTVEKSSTFYHDVFIQLNQTKGSNSNIIKFKDNLIKYILHGFNSVFSPTVKALYGHSHVQ